MIDTKALRSRVLDLAIQGKLTEQLESDGTAEELYQQIQAEKQRLIKEGKIKREKPLPEIIPDEIPFETPGNWKWVRWGEIVNIVSARRVHQSDWKTEGVPFYRAREIARLAENGYVDNDLFISEELYNEFSKSGIPHAGDIMISAVGTLGKAYVVKANDKFYYKDASVLCIENIGHIIPEYLIWVMRSDFMRSQIASNSGGTTVDTLTMVRMIKYLFPLPPLAEQKRIVACVEEIFRLLDIIDAAQEQYAADAESLKAKLITLGIQGRLTEQLESDGTAEELYQQIQAEKQRLIQEGRIKKEKPLPEISEEEIPFEIPENWKWCRLGDCIRLQSGQDFKPEDYNDNRIGTPYLTGASNIDADGSLIINRWTEKPTCIAETNDVLIVCKGSGYGKITICTIDYAHIARQFMAVKHSEFLDSNYMKLFLISKLSVIKGNGQGLIPGIDRPSVLNLEIPLPPLAEQKRIAETLERVLGVL